MNDQTFPAQKVFYEGEVFDADVFITKALFPKRVGNGQFGPAGAVGSSSARSPGVASLRLGLFKLGPAGALSAAKRSCHQEPCLPRAKGRRAAQYE